MRLDIGIAEQLIRMVEREGFQIVEACQMVVVEMCVEYCGKFCRAGAQHLVAKIGAGVDQYIARVALQQHRRAQASVFREA